MNEPLPLSLLNDFLYCPRRAALKEIEGWREANEHTVLGDLAHEHADLPGYEIAKGVTLWRALPVWSDRLGLSGKCDVVEVEHRQAENLKSEILNLTPKYGIRRTKKTSGTQWNASLPALGFSNTTEPGSKMGVGPENLKSEISNWKSIRPVEYKKGKRRRFENDDAQLCAQAMCLEEMFGLPIGQGAVFHAESKRRREVAFTLELRGLVEKAVADLQLIIEQFETPNMKGEIAAVPSACFKPACKECSLYEICLPEATSLPSRVAQAGKGVFQI